MKPNASIFHRHRHASSIVQAAVLMLVFVGISLFAAGCDSTGPDSTGLKAEDSPEGRQTSPDGTSGGLQKSGDLGYNGRSSNASWRTNAQDRIEEHRKADLTVNVVDSNGNALSNATVDVQMQQHEFNFGTAINADIIREQTSSDEDTYRKKFLNTFNYGTIETRLKVYRWEDNPNVQKDVHFTIDWLNNHGLSARGHAAVWERWWWNNMDKDSDHYYKDLTGQQIHDRIKSLIQNRVSEFSGEVRDWDMQNHPKHRQDIRTYLADNYSMGWHQTVPEWWSVAQNNDPNANMGINEQNIVQAYDWANWSDWKNSYEWWISDFLPNNGVQVDNIGMMAHAQLGRLTGIPTVLDVFDRFGQYAPIYISEFHVTYPNWSDRTWADGSSEEKAIQADYVRDFLTAAFSHPDVETVVHWTFWEGAAWRKTSALYGPNWTLRDHGQKWKQLVYQDWWTDVSGQTDGSGAYTKSAFKGKYKVTVSKDGESKTVAATLSDGGTSVTVSLPVQAQQFDPNKKYKIEAVHSGKVLDVDGWGTSDGANVHQWTDYGNDNQRWYIEDTGSGKYKIEAVHSGKVLEVDDAKTGDGANVQQWTDSGWDNQRWYIENTGSGKYKVEAVHSGKVLEVDDAKTGDGANVQQWTDSGWDNQRWYITAN
jgi:GH35 family endo-1,4-beta-xylanase